MLDYLRVENFAVVEKVELEFSGGLNVLTGETGAGKSILIGAVTLFFQKKLSPSILRDPEKKLVVEAMISRGDDEFILRREVGAKKSQAFINGQMVTFEQLKEKAEGLFTIYGQNEHVFLLNPVNHRVFLDEFCKNRDILDTLGESSRALSKAAEALHALKKKKENAAERLDYIQFQIREIRSLEMNEGDDELLEQRYKILTSAEEILSRSNILVETFYQGEPSIHGLLAQNREHLDYLGEIYPDLRPFNDEIQKFQDMMPELSTAISSLIGKVEYNEDELREVENNLNRLNSLKVKYKASLSELLRKLALLEHERDELMNMSYAIADLEKEVARLLDVYRTAHGRLREARRTRAGELSHLVEKELARLEMKRPRFLVHFREVEPDLTNFSEKGVDMLEFYFSSNPGQEPGRIQNIASGGELSRLMLVLKSILNTGEYGTYIFDEIDTGIGGKTAEFVGEKLKRIAKHNQVLCISHLPQIASFADAHFLIAKSFRKDETFTQVAELSQDDRVSEIARLMVGGSLNDDVLKAARALLEKNR